MTLVVVVVVIPACGETDVSQQGARGDAAHLTVVGETERAGIPSPPPPPSVHHLSSLPSASAHLKVPPSATTQAGDKSSAYEPLGDTWDPREFILEHQGPALICTHTMGLIIVKRGVIHKL